MKKYLGILFLFLAVAGVRNACAQGADEPYPVKDIKPVVLQDPYLIDPSETGMTVAWLTDSMSQSQVIYWEKGAPENKKVAVRQAHGLLAIGTFQWIRLSDLHPGQTYNYKVRSRRVVKIKPYWPVMGKWVESPVYSFTTFDRNKSEIHFSSISDTHENVERIKELMNLVDWSKTDFFVQTGDALNYVVSQKQIFNKFLTPIADGLNQKIPFLYVRGNHDLRGPYARHWFDYFPYHGGNFYFTFNEGPAHFIVIDSGEDKPDSTNVYSGLNDLKDYRADEFAWVKKYVDTSKALKDAPFRILLVHDPHWGWVDGQNEKWTKLANKANVDLVISGHWHRFKRINPGGKSGNDYPILVVGQKDVAHFEVTRKYIKVVVEDVNQETVDAFKIDRKGNILEL
ncbi:MAG TPA: metallophosphoesterase family protein [Chitinophagaceae bacterium]|nr:metallophosphoesterase family protein [Chitinophagaceae bacterium]